jgi:hypothetical protein
MVAVSGTADSRCGMPSLLRTNKTLSGAPEKERRKWAQRVFAQMAAANLLRPEWTFLWLVGAMHAALMKLRLSGLVQALDIRLQEVAGNHLGHAEVYTLCALLERGWSHRRITAVLGIDRETVARYARLAAAGGAPPGPAPDGAGVYERDRGRRDSLE